MFCVIMLATAPLLLICGALVRLLILTDTVVATPNGNAKANTEKSDIVRFRVAIFCSNRQTYSNKLGTCFPRFSNFAILCESYQFAADYANRHILANTGMMLEVEIRDICSSDDIGYEKTMLEILEHPDFCNQIPMSSPYVNGSESLLVGIAGTQSAALGKVQLAMFHKFCMPIMPALTTTDDLEIFDNFVQTAPEISRTSKILIKLLSTFHLTLVTVVYDTDDMGTSLLQRLQTDLDDDMLNYSEICIETTIPIISNRAVSDHDWEVALSTIDAGKSRILILLLGQDSAYEMIEQITKSRPHWSGEFLVIFGSALTVLRMEEHQRRRHHDILDNSLAVEAYILDSLNYTGYLETLRLDNNSMLSPLIQAQNDCLFPSPNVCPGNATLKKIPQAICKSASFCISSIVRMADALKQLNERNCGRNRTSVCPEFWSNKFHGLRGDHLMMYLNKCYDSSVEFKETWDVPSASEDPPSVYPHCSQTHYGVYQYRKDFESVDAFSFVKIADYMPSTDSLELDWILYNDSYMEFLAKNHKTVLECKHCLPFQTWSRLGQCCVQCKNCTSDYEHVHQNNCVECPMGQVQFKENNTCVDAIFKISTSNDERIIVFVALSYLGIALVVCVTATIVVKRRSPAAQMSLTAFIIVMALTSSLDFVLCLMSAKDLTAGECEAVWVIFSAGWTVTAGSMIMKLYLYSHLTKFPPPLRRMDKSSLVAMVIALTLTQFVLYQIMLTISGHPEIDLVKSLPPSNSDPGSSPGYMQICTWFSPDIFIFLAFPSCLILVVIVYALTLTKITIRYIHREIKFLLISGIFMLAAAIIFSPSLSAGMFTANVSDQMLFFMTFCLFFGSVKLSCLLLPTTILIVFRPRRNTLDYISSQKMPKISFKSGSVFKIHLERIGNSIVNELPLTRRKSSFIAQPGLEPIIERESSNESAEF